MATKALAVGDRFVLSDLIVEALQKEVASDFEVKTLGTCPGLSSPSA
jgi:hypothetical protein